MISLFLLINLREVHVSWHVISTVYHRSFNMRWWVKVTKKKITEDVTECFLKQCYSAHHKSWDLSWLTLPSTSPPPTQHCILSSQPCNNIRGYCLEIWVGCVWRSSRNPYPIQTRVLKPYSISDQVGQNLYPFFRPKWLEKHTHWRHTHLSI